jgi:signal transduction histidine kinase
MFDLLVEQADRMSTTIDRYRGLGRVDPHRETLDLNALVEKTLSLQLKFPAKVSVQLELAADLPALNADPELLAAAVHNLVRNALEAMPKEGTLLLETRLVDGPHERGIRLSVIDTGYGMDARVREQAFEEFFTTKSTGTGMGLAFVRRVVEAHGGEVQLTSQEGRGTRVQLFLPA